LHEDFRDGDLVIVTWIDCEGYINEDRENVSCPPAINVGWLFVGKDELLLKNGYYINTPDNGDWTAIPKGCVKRIELIRGKQDG
jgi:hypothetical protein